MTENTIICTACGRTFTAATGAQNFFCTYCGAPQAAGGAGEAQPIVERLARVIEPQERIDALAVCAADEATTDTDLLSQLFGLRYTTTGGRKKTVLDGFVRLWFDLVIYSKQYERKTDAKMAAKELDKFFTSPGMTDFLAQGARAQELLELELRNAVYVYFESSRSDRVYTTGMLNLFQLKKGDVTAKAARDAVLGSVAILHSAGRMEQYGMIVRAAKEGYLMAFPEGLGDYNKVYNEWKAKVGFAG